jgi:putative ABC transport system ATP-binding protein
VFQFGELLPELTLAENVELPMRLLGIPNDEVVERSGAVLAELGISQLGDSLPDSVSGGERPRRAGCRSAVERMSSTKRNAGGCDP